MAWELKMFLVSVAGALAGLLWPLMIALWRAQTAVIYRWMKPPQLGAEGDSGVSAMWRFIRKFVVPPAVFIILALAIAGIAAALGFAGFLQEPEMRKQMQALGLLGYFTAFTYGFGAASLVEEPLKG